jgi:hypothetical protein
MRLPDFLVNLALFVFATIVSVAILFGAGELYLRVRAGGATQYMPWMEFHPERGWALKPGDYAGYEVNESRKTRIFVNDLGLRNSPVSPAVPPGRRRLSIVGDSFVFAAALEDRETIAGQLGGLLGDRSQVVNLGVEGYGTGQECLLVEDLTAHGYTVGDAIVLVFFTNDILDNLALSYGGGDPVPTTPRFWVDSTGVLRHTRPQARRTYPWGRKLAKNWMFYRYLRSRATNLMLSNPWVHDLAGKLGFRPNLPRIPGVVEGFYSAGWQERWKNTEEILGYFSRLARGRLGSQLVVAFVPSPFQVMGTLREMATRQARTDSIYAAYLADVDRPQRCLREFCDRSGLTFIDATPALREAARTRSPYLVEAHLNAFGSKIVAQSIRDGITSRLPP